MHVCLWIFGGEGAWYMHDCLWIFGGEGAWNMMTVDIWW